MTKSEFDILYEDNHLLVVNKPALLPTMGVTADRPSLVTLAKAYLKQRYNKPGNVYLGVVSRLDAAASGVIVLARTSKAAARLSEQFRDRRVEKNYWALVSGRVEPPSGQWSDWIAKDEKRQRMVFAKESTRGAKRADLAYKRIRVLGPLSLLDIQLTTGRKHQIRLQLAAHGLPILGDRKYGGREPFAEGIALHARRLVIRHPVRDEKLELVAPLPATWHRLGIAD